MGFLFYFVFDFIIIIIIIIIIITFISMCNYFYICIPLYHVTVHTKCNKKLEFINFFFIIMMNIVLKKQ